ncbi:MAG TPA: cell division protein FtsZ [Candidatus Norongarragalinales archaeon]|nr:cell division protein FtsZ [Candidatus Norongarragalinales archaeon]
MESLIRDALSNNSASSKTAADNKAALMTPSKIQIKVIGIGGGGCNSVDRLHKMGLVSATTMAINTDANHLKIVQADKKVLIGASLTKGMGAGGFPEVGMKAAESCRAQLETMIGNPELVFITTGLGGGTGSGAAPVVADICKRAGAITIAVVTFPFALERARLDKADWALEKLTEVCDTVIIVDNNKLVSYVPNLPMNQAFQVADTLLARSIKGIADTIMLPSLMNIDFADVRMITSNRGVAMISVGEASGSERVEKVIKNTLDHPLLDVDTAGAKGGLILIQGGAQLTLGEAIKIGEGVTEAFDPHAYVKWGARIVPEMNDKIIVTAVLTGISSAQIIGKTEAPKATQYQYVGVDSLF